MTTTAPAYDWPSQPSTRRTPHPTATAARPAARPAWTAARPALLAGELDTLAVTIGDHHCGASYTPAHDHQGRIDPDQLTAALIDLHQAVTAGEIADQLTAPPT